MGTIVWTVCRGKGNQIVAVSSKSEPYFAREFDVPTGDGFAHDQA